MKRFFRLFEIPGRVAAQLTCGEADPWFYGIAALSLVLCGFHLSWGLPNGNSSWAADALGPLSVLSIAKRSVSTFNSGWFWYKYPFGFPLLLLIVYAPYLGWLWVTGDFRNPSTTYPYGFADPERALYVMAMLGRAVNVVLVVGTVVLTYGITRRLSGRTAARAAAWFAATAYPLIFYAHTTNQDAAYMFWLTLTVWGTLVAIEGEKPWPYAVLGVGAAMAMATKEQGVGLLLALAIALAMARFQNQPRSLPLWMRLRDTVWARPIAAALAGVVGGTLVGNNALINPMGIVNRMLDLTGHPVAGMSSRLTPIKFSLFKGIEKETWYLRQLADVTESTFGLPLLLCALAGLVYLAARDRRARLCILWPAAAYYLISLRTHDLLGLRYTLPLVPLLAAGAGVACAWALERSRRLGRVLTGGLGLLALLRGLEMVAILYGDSRYQAEAWMAANLPAGVPVEYYQKPVYVPRTTGFAGTAVPLDQRTLAGLEERRPEAIVLSSAGRKSITHFWTMEWSEGNLLTERPAAREMLDALEGGRLPYRLVATFRQDPVFLRQRITSLCPEIRIFRRTETAPE